MRVHLLVKPSKLNTRIIDNNGEFIVELKSKPIDGAANTELIEVLAKHLNVSKTHIKIAKGANNRHKTIEII